MKFFLIFVILPICFCKDTFKENLFISNFNDAISFHFDFQTTTSDLLSNNYHLFPKVMSEIIKQHSVSEMHLSLSKGFWDTENWGLQPVPVPSESAELYAWFETFEKKIDEKWDHLSHALSGLFCASLNKLSNKMERISPNWAYSPKGLNSKIRNNSYVRKSVLSGEAVCTENLTPWIKLLPCKKLAGLAQLMKPSRLFSSHFTSITVSVKKICMSEKCDSIGRLIHQTMTLVLDRRIFGNYQNIWSLKELLNTNSNIELCQLADISRIYVQGFGDKTNLHLVPTDDLVPNKLFYYDLKNLTKINNKLNLDISGIWPVGSKYNDMTGTFPVLITKFSTGSGNINGGIKSIIRSNSDRDLRVVYEESLPWYFQFLFHTLVIEINSMEGKPEKVYYVPSINRQRMTHLELVFTVPARSTVVIQYQFRKVLQNWNEYPPDANHEFYIGASSLTFSHSSPLPSQNNSLWDMTEAANMDGDGHRHTGGKAVRIYSEVVLVTMPCPDFSMPFNALCLACTVLAVMVGGIHKYTTSSICMVDPSKEGIKGKLTAVIGLVLAKLSRFIKKEPPIVAADH